MASRIESKIAEALLGRLRDLKLRPRRLPIAWPNRNYNALQEGQPKPTDWTAEGAPLEWAMPPEELLWDIESTGGRYLEAALIPNGAQRQHINSDGVHRFIGILQVSVHWPHDDGIIAPLEAAGAIADWFPADLRLVSGGVEVRITKRPDVGGTLTEDAGVMIPVTIEWESFE